MIMIVYKMIVKKQSVNLIDPTIGWFETTTLLWGMAMLYSEPPMQVTPVIMENSDPEVCCSLSMFVRWSSWEMQTKMQTENQQLQIIAVILLIT